jgi:hypothetical protein
LEAVPIYGIMIELDEYIDAKGSQKHLILAEKEWMFEQRQLWQLERHNAFTENRMLTKFIGRQPNLINNNLIRETSFVNNSVSIFPLRNLSQDNIQKNRPQKKKEKEVFKLSRKLKNQEMKNLTIISSIQRVECFPDENIFNLNHGPFRYSGR